jgi:hypothetical protein
MVTETFAKWAVGFSGCDGGDPTGIWVCGIEFGQGHTEDNLKLEEDVSKPGYVGGVGWEDSDVEKFLTYQYNRKALKLLCALAGHDVGKYQEFYETEQCFRERSRYFKLNLYPIGFKDTSPEHWREWLAPRTGFETKQEYKEWCHRNRFPVLREWVQKYRPRLIVCTGISYRTEFFKAFGDGTQNPQVDNGVGKPIWYTVTNAGRTLVAVIYFLGGRKGLKSDPELSATGKRLAGLLHKIDGGAQSAQ